MNVLRPQGMPIEVRRRRDGDHLVGDDLDFTARLDHLAPSDTHSNAVPRLHQEI